MSGGIIDRTDRELGRHLFENESGVTGNLIGRYMRWRARRGSDISPDPDTDPARFDEGLQTVGQVMDREAIDALDYEDHLHGEDAVVARQDGTVIRQRLESDTFDFSTNLPGVQDAVTDDVLEMVRAYYGSHVTVSSVFLWRNHHAPQGRMWHFDPWDTDQVKLFVLLTDTDEAHGPTAYLPRDASRDILHEYSPSDYRVPDSPAADHPDVRTFTGPAGRGALGNVTQFIHQGTNPEPGNHRDILQIVFAPSREPLPDDWIHETERYAHGESDWSGLGRLLGETTTRR